MYHYLPELVAWRLKPPADNRPSARVSLIGFRILEREKTDEESRCGCSSLNSINVTVTMCSFVPLAQYN